MKGLLLLGINLFVLMISDANAAKLIIGEHTVIKKDGATHTISKYYLVPNDYDPKNNTISIKTSESTNSDMNNNDYSESMDSGATYEDQVGGGLANNNESNDYSDQVSKSSENSVSAGYTKASYRSDQNNSQVQVHANDNTAETVESVSMDHSVEGDGNYNLLVQPLVKPMNKSSNDTVDTDKADNTLQNDSSGIVENSTETSEEKLDDKLDDLILMNFGIAVHELSIRNIDSFWKIVKLYVDGTPDDSKFMEKLDRLSLLLSIFTYLHQAAQSQKPFESMIDCIIDILQIPNVEKRCPNQSQSDIICGRNSEESHLASNGGKLIELEGWKPSIQPSTGNLELENRDSQGSLAKDSNTYKLSIPNNDDRRLDELTDGTEPFPVPDYLRVGASNGSNNNSTITPPTLQHAPRDKVQDSWISTDKSPVSIESRLGDVEGNSSESSVTKPSVLDNKSKESGETNTRMVYDKPTDPSVNRSWSLEGNSPKSSKPKPWIIEDKSPETTTTKLGDVDDTSLDSGIVEPKKISPDKSTVSKVTTNQPVSFLISSSEFYGDQSTIGPTIADDQPLTTESSLSSDYPLTDTSGMAGDQPLSTESTMAEDQPLTTESRLAKDEPLSAESRLPSEYPLTTSSEISEDQPLSAESRLPSEYPLTTSSEISEDQPLSAESRLLSEYPLTTSSEIAADQPLSAESRLPSEYPLTTSTEMAEDQPLGIESRLAVDEPWNDESKITGDQPLTTESDTVQRRPSSTILRMPKDQQAVDDNSTEYLPIDIRAGALPTDKHKSAQKVPRYIKDKTSDKVPWHIEYKFTDKLPHSIEDRIPVEDRMSDKLPWHIQDKTNHKTTNIPWIIEDRLTRLPGDEDNITDDSPSTMYQSSSPDDKTYNGKIILEPNQHSSSSRVKNTNKKPYHIYIYVIKPKKLYERHKSGKIGHVKYEKPISNHVTKSYTQSTTHGNKDVHKPSNYELRLLEPVIKISNQKDNHKPKSNVQLEKKSNPKSKLLLPTETRTTSDEDNDGAQTSPQDSSSDSEFIKPNKYHSPSVTNRAVLKHQLGMIDMVPYHPPENTNKAENYEATHTVDDPDHTLDEHDEPNTIHGDNTPQDLDYIPHPTAQAEITIPNEEYHYSNPTSSEAQSKSDEDNDNPYYNSHDSTHSEFSTSNDYDNPISGNSEDVYGDDYTPQRPGYNSHSQVFTSNDYNNPTSSSSEDENEDENTPQRPGYNYHSSAHSQVFTANDSGNPTSDKREDINQNAGVVPKNPHEINYADIPNDHDEPTSVGGKNTNGYNSHSSENSKVTITNANNNKPTFVKGEDTDQNAGVVPKDPYEPEYADIPNDYDEPKPVDDKNTNGYNSHSSTHSKVTIINDNNNQKTDSSEYIDPGSVSKVSHQQENTKDPYYHDEATPVIGENTPQRPGHNSHSSVHAESKQIPNNHNSGNLHYYHDFSSMVPYRPGSAKKVQDQNPINVVHTGQYSKSDPEVSHQQEYTNDPDDYDEPTPIGGGISEGYDSHVSEHSKGSTSNDYRNPKSTSSENVNGEENTPKRPGYNSHSSGHSKVTIIHDINNPTSSSSEDIEQNAGVIPEVPEEPDYANIFNDLYDYDEPIPASYTSKGTAHKEFTIPNEDDYPTPDNGQNILDDPFPNGSDTPENVNEQDYDDKQIPDSEPDSQVISHSQYTNLPNDYTTDYDNIDKSQILIHKDPEYAEHTDILNKNNIFRPKFVDVGHKIYKIQPSLIAYLHNKRPKKLKYQKKLKIPQTYQLFTLTNVIKLYDAVTKAIEQSNVKDSDYSALINLRKIIRLIVMVAEKIEKQGGRNKWYEKIFLNAKENRHPLQLYVYKLIRQRWLHELLLILNKQNFDSHILQKPKIFPFLGSWKFPKYVQIFLKAADLIQNDLGTPVDGDTLNDLQDWFSTKKYDDLVEEVPGGIESYVTKKVINSYDMPNDGIVVSIAGVEAEPDARAIINILQQYLHHKKIINNQENVIIRENKFEMLKRVELFLKRKGYDAATISNLIHKLYSAVYSTNGKECQPHQPQFAEKMFNVILPVLRRSGH